jgi:RimJ/RimL family protein N-acetyltransferase
MNLITAFDVGAGLRLRTLTVRDAGLLVEATGAETARALWDARPAGPYTPAEARAALRAWDPDAGGDVSYGILRDGRLLTALGLMPDGPGSAELAYWVRPESRRQGLALLGLRALTRWAHHDAGLARIWLEINPANIASLRLAERAGYLYEQRLARHCRTGAGPDPAHDTWHDCLIWAHTEPGPPPAA